MNHSIRSYLLGKAYAENKQIRFDDEGLCVAALFHDLGLCPAYRDRSRAFPHGASRALRAFLRKHECDEARIASFSDAVDFHFGLFPRWADDPVVGLLHVGAWMDVTRRKRWTVTEKAREVTRAYPRIGFDRRFALDVLRSIGGARSCVGLLFPGRERGA